MMDWLQLIGMKEATELYNRDSSTLKRAISNGTIVVGVDCKKFGRDWVFYKPNLDRIYLQERKNLKKPL